MNKVFRVLLIMLITLFLSLYFSKYNSNYYENKMLLTDEALARFEEDLKNGVEIKADNYITTQNNYNNKASNMGIKVSNVIEKSFNKALSYLMKYLERLQNS